MWFPEGPERGSRAGCWTTNAGSPSCFQPDTGLGGGGAGRDSKDSHNLAGCGASTALISTFLSGQVCFATGSGERPGPLTKQDHPSSQASPPQALELLPSSGLTKEPPHTHTLISLLLPSPDPGPTNHLILRGGSGSGSRTHALSCPAPVPPTADSLMRNLGN